MCCGSIIRLPFLGLIIAASVAARAAEVPVPEGHVTPSRYLAGLTPPECAPGHTLPRLTRYGGIIDLDTRVDFARRWGYALQWGPVAFCPAKLRKRLTPGGHADLARFTVLPLVSPSVPSRGVFHVDCVDLAERL